jgi:predicted SprT family Zn-dependent metalloprotease
MDMDAEQAMKKAGNKRKRQTGKEVNYDLFESRRKGGDGYNGNAARKLLISPGKPKIDLPSVSELQHLFTRLNNLFFDGKLKKTTIEYSSRMTCAGSYCPDDAEIKISRRYHEIFPDEIEDTLKHEMIHIKHFYHDAEFKAEAKRIGASLKAKTHPLLQRHPKFLYVCPGCRTKYPRQKKMSKHSCGDCSANKKYDPRFRLMLVKPDSSDGQHT